jgi:hypothetical protein
MATMNPLTNETITSGIPKLPVPRVKKEVKENFENKSQPITQMIETMQEQIAVNNRKKDAMLEASKARSLSQSTYQKQIPASRQR